MKYNKMVLKMPYGILILMGKEVNLINLLCKMMEILYFTNQTDKHYGHLKYINYYFLKKYLC
jgi:membrane associated rhomboid family serine protease